MEKILVIDDEPLIRHFLSEALSEKGLTVHLAQSVKEALSFAKKETYDVILTDLKLPDGTGLDLLKSVKEHQQEALVIMMTAHGTVENAVAAMQLGAFHYILKPFALDALEVLLEKAKEHLALTRENTFLKQERNHCVEFIFTSSHMQKLLTHIRKIAKSSATVFIHGESGTGKEVIASTIAHHSLRQSKPYVKVNCAAIAETLIESEFFGYEKGSFTGALNRKIGRFELANEGTLLLDEVTEIPLSLQPKLLRVIQEQEFERVGGTKSIKVDVRLIATSNRDLKQAIAEGIFREDLFYRLNVVPISIPPLRDRRDDILPLANSFLKRFCIENHKKPKQLSSKSEKQLLDYHWPGNVRELANLIERAVVLDQEDNILNSEMLIH